MTNFDIRLNIPRLAANTIRLGSRLDDKELNIVVGAFAAYLRELYGLMVEEAINSNRYKGEWEPRDDEGYQEYIGTKPTTSMITLISRSLYVKKRNREYIVTFDERKRYPGSKLTIFRVLKAIEYGTSKFNARPMMVKITRKLNRNLLSLWKGFLTMKGVI